MAQESKTTGARLHLQKSTPEFPALPGVVRELQALIRRPEASFSQVADLLRKDLALTGRVLKLVNSSYYSIPGGVSDVQRALTFLGLTTLSQVVMSASIYSLFEERSSEQFNFRTFWKHCLAVAVCTEVLAKEFRIEKAEEAFTAGLLHDVGKLYLLSMSADSFFETLVRSRKEGLEFSEAEIENSVTHGGAGVLAAQAWNLPLSLQKVIEWHHVQGVLPPLDLDLRRSLAAVRVADAWCTKKGYGAFGPDTVGSTVLKSEIECLQVGASQAVDLKRVDELLEGAIEKAGALLNAY